MKIYKYPLEIGVTNTLNEPIAKPLHVGFQEGRLYLWAEVYDDGIRVARYFEVVGTGWDLPRDFREYIGTSFCNGYVWHTYEISAPRPEGE